MELNNSDYFLRARDDSSILYCILYTRPSFFACVYHKIKLKKKNPARSDNLINRALFSFIVLSLSFSSIPAAPISVINICVVTRHYIYMYICARVRTWR